MGNRNYDFLTRPLHYVATREVLSRCRGTLRHHSRKLRIKRINLLLIQLIDYLLLLLSDSLLVDSHFCFLSRLLVWILIPTFIGALKFIFLLCWLLLVLFSLWLSKPQVFYLADNRRSWPTLFGVFLIGCFNFEDLVAKRIRLLQTFYAWHLLGPQRVKRIKKSELQIHQYVVLPQYIALEEDKEAIEQEPSPPPHKVATKRIQQRADQPNPKAVRVAVQVGQSLYLAAVVHVPVQQRVEQVKEGVSVDDFEVVALADKLHSADTSL